LEVKPKKKQSGCRADHLKIILSVIIFIIAMSEEAMATHKIYSPKVHKGEWEFEMRGHLD